MEKIKTWILSVPQEKRSMWDIITWWEFRRIPYNVIIGIYGLISLILFFFFISHSNELKPGEDAVEPLVLLFAPIMINLCYTSGWIFEVFVSLLLGKRFNRISRGLYLAGITLSLVVASIPSVWWAVVWLYRLTHGKT